jgi:arginine decarboxylase
VCKPGDIVIVDRNCHKSHHYGFVLSGAQPYYVEAFPLTQYSMYGAVPLKTDQEGAVRLRRRRHARRGQGHRHDQLHLRRPHVQPARVMEECLAIKPDLIFLWDEAWFGFARFSPFHRRRTAMGAAAALTERFRSKEYRAAYAAWAKKNPEARPEEPEAAGRAPDGGSGQGAHPRLRDALDPQVDVVLPTGLDDAGVGRRLAQGRRPVHRGVPRAHLDLAQPAVDRLARHLAAADGAGRLRADRAHDRPRDPHAQGDQCARADLQVLPRRDPRGDDPEGVPRVGHQDYGPPYSDLGRQHRGLDEDEFALDPRASRGLRRRGFDGTQLKAALSDRFDIQINKTSRNSILVQTNINNTHCDAALLIKAFADLAREIDQRLSDAARVAKAKLARV